MAIALEVDYQELRVQGVEREESPVRQLEFFLAEDLIEK
jgi:hypothetical protein